jgi:hypothetical protein
MVLISLKANKDAAMTFLFPWLEGEPEIHIVKLRGAVVFLGPKLPQVRDLGIGVAGIHHPMGICRNMTIK